MATVHQTSSGATGWTKYQTPRKLQMCLNNPKTQQKGLDMFEFLQSLGIFGYIILGVLALLIWNIRKIIFLRSPLDSQQHKLWRATQGGTEPDHLTKKSVDKDV